MKRKLFILLLLLLTFQNSSAQEKSISILIDEFGDIGCEDFLARIDNFISQLQTDLNSHGYMVIYGKNDNSMKKVRYELWFNGALKFRNYDASKVTKIRGSKTEDLRIQLWQVPVNAERPLFKEAKWNFILPPSTKPFIFHAEIDDQICSSVSFEKVFAEYLVANTEARGNIVVYTESIKRFTETKSDIQKLLSEIPKTRLRFFFIRADSTYTEFWIVPKKK